MSNIPKKYKLLWNEVVSILEQQCRNGDDKHAEQVAENVIKYYDVFSKKLNLDLDVLIPVAMMHDIGHSGILPEHFYMITGPNKYKNGKLVHMLIGAKIAKDMLISIKYPEEKIDEIVDIISMHDADQLENKKWRNIYNSDNKKFFHDLDALDRYDFDRLLVYKNKIHDDKIFMKYLLDTWDKTEKNFFYKEFNEIAKKIKKDILNKFKLLEKQIK